MKVIAINGSTRAKGNTHIALEKLKESMELRCKDFGEELDYTIIDLAKKELNPCKACYACKEKKQCVQNDDMTQIFKEMIASDGIVLASPTYFSNVSSRMQMVVERTGIMSRANGGLLKGKIGASIAVARRQGANVVYSALNYFFGIAEMPIASSSYWNICLGKDPGDIENDTEGMEIISTLGANMADMLCKMRK